MKLATAVHAMTLIGALAPRASANETCATAEVIPLTSTAECTTGGTYGNNFSADLSFNVPSCDATNNGITDLWYAFNSDNNTTIHVYLGTVEMTDYAFAVFQGCGGPEVACAINPNGYVVVPTTPYVEYRIQVYSNLDYGTGGEFVVCAMWTTPPPPPPANDDCAGSILLASGPACNYTNGSSSYATFSSVPMTNPCSGDLVANDDVWYRFVAPPDAVTITVDGDGNATTGYDPVISLAYASGCGGTFNNLLDCQDATGPGGTESVSVDFLLPGSTYYIRVFDAGDQNPVPGTFRICVQSGGGTGTDDVEGENTWVVARDQFSGLFELRAPSAWHGPVVVEVLDMLGRAILHQTVRPTDSNAYMLDLSAFRAGGYVIAVMHNGKRSTLKLQLY